MSTKANSNYAEPVPDSRFELNEAVLSIGGSVAHPSTFTLDDRARSNNNDRDKVLATVALTIIDFFQYHPEAVVYAIGSTPVRTRLYQIGIFKYWHQISQLISIKVFINENWESIEKHKNYDAFLAVVKKI